MYSTGSGLVGIHQMAVNVDDDSAFEVLAMDIGILTLVDDDGTNMWQDLESGTFPTMGSLSECTTTKQYVVAQANTPILMSVELSTGNRNWSKYYGGGQMFDSDGSAGEFWADDSCLGQHPGVVSADHWRSGSDRRRR